MIEDKKVKELTLEEFSNLIREVTNQKINAIDLFGIQVSSSTESLAKVEESFNRIVKKHRDLILQRKNTKEKVGYV